jgi:hypothetical protein
MNVAEAAAVATPTAVTSADMGATTAMATTKGPKTMAVAPITASVLARITQAFFIGAEAIRSGASSPEIASQARPPANCPAAMISIGTSSVDAPLPSWKLRHKMKAGGTR